jgi:hypothetical protein
VKLGTSVDEKCEILSEEYATEAVKKLRILEWHELFKVGRESVENNLRGVVTSEKRPEENAENLWRSCCTDKQFSVGGMDHVSNWTNFKGDLCMKNFCKKTFSQRFF